MQVPGQPGAPASGPPREPAAARAVAARLPAAPGVYRFRDAQGRVLYMGRAVSLRRRAVSYWGDLGDRGHLAGMVARIARVEAVVCDSAHEAAWLERNLLQRALPPWNRSRNGGQEVAVWIRVSESPRSPGVRVVHAPRAGDPSRYFGPYLGAQKARDAASALCRVLPLGHAADTLKGSERDLAALRGACPAARAGLARAVAAVLDRDPEAVRSLRAKLTGRRDAAAARLAFEAAARLQAEIEALDWITAEQKATLAEPVGFDVHGWADGMLVRFEIRGGRLCGWTQRACPEVAARPHIGDTPPTWAGFARRNAELAARLAR